MSADFMILRINSTFKESPGGSNRNKNYGARTCDSIVQNSHFHSSM